MYAKGTMGFLGALALVMSMLPAAAAGVPVPGETTVLVLYEGLGTAAATGDDAVSGAAAAEMALQTGADAFAASVGNLFLDEDGLTLNNGEIDVPALFDASADASTAVFTAVLTESGDLQGYGVNSAETMGLAGEGSAAGSIAAANEGIDTTVDFGFATQRTVDTTIVSLGASTQSVARSFGGVQAVVVQGSVDTYNNHAAPAMCAFAGIAGDFSGAVDSESSCGALLL